jgi:hypothetical protein
MAAQPAKDCQFCWLECSQGNIKQISGSYIWNGRLPGSRSDAEHQIPGSTAPATDR